MVKGSSERRPAGESPFIFCKESGFLQEPMEGAFQQE